MHGENDFKCERDEEFSLLSVHVRKKSESFRKLLKCGKMIGLEVYDYLMFVKGCHFLP